MLHVNLTSDRHIGSSTALWKLSAHARCAEWNFQYRENRGLKVNHRIAVDRGCDRHEPGSRNPCIVNAGFQVTPSMLLNTRWLFVWPGVQGCTRLLFQSRTGRHQLTPIAAILRGALSKPATCITMSKNTIRLSIGSHDLYHWLPHPVFVLLSVSVV